MTAFLRTLVISLLTAMGTTLGACDQSGKRPAPGRVSLEYVETSGTYLVFKLGNGSSQTITFMGLSRLSGSLEPSPSAIAMECQAAQSAVSVEEPFALADGPPEATVRVLPGEQVRLLVLSTFAIRHKGSRCRLRLRTQEDSAIASLDFVP
jgi:hypothetical protein